MDTSDLGFHSKPLARFVGLEASVVFNKIQWCLESPTMLGTVYEGIKYIRNPIKCTNPRKQAKKTEGKEIDWFGNFQDWASEHKVRRIIDKLVQRGLLIVRKLRAHCFDQCNYYTINYPKLAELLEPAPLSIWQNQPNRLDETEHIDVLTVAKSYQDTIPEKVFQKQPLTERAGGTVLVKVEEDEETSQQTVNYQVDQKSNSITEPITLQVEKYSAPSSSVERQKFFETLLAYCYQRVDIDSPEGYANWVMKESKSKAPEASVAMLWDEFNAGEELGSRMVPAGYRLRGVPEQVVAEAITQDCVSKVGATATEAAKNAAGQLRRLPVVAAVANAVKLQLERCIEGATRQVELGIPKEQAVLNNLPTYALACNEDATRQIAASEAVETPRVTDATDPYALTEENRAARNRAFETIQAVKAISAKLPRRQTKREQILAANRAEAAESIKLMPIKTEVAVKSMIQASIEDEPILW